MAFRHWLRRYIGMPDLNQTLRHNYERIAQDRYMEGFKDGTEKAFGVTLTQMTYLRRFWEENDMPWPPSMQSLMRWKTLQEKKERANGV